MNGRQTGPDAVRYIGNPGTRQIEGRWLDPGEIIAGPSGLVDALAALPDFQVVDVTLSKDQAEAVAEADEEK